MGSWDLAGLPEMSADVFTLPCPCGCGEKVLGTMHGFGLPGSAADEERQRDRVRRQEKRKVQRAARRKNR
jgi:hypothetical protein